MKEQQYKEYLVLNDEFQTDTFLYLPTGCGNKYSLNVEALNKHTEFIDCLQAIYDNFEECRGNRKNSENAKKIISEFLGKFCIIVDYPNVCDVKKLVFQEILLEHGLHNKDFNLVTSYMMEFEKAQVMDRRGTDDKFLSNDDWKKVVASLKSYSEGLKVKGISDYTIDTVLNSYSCIKFERSKIQEMYDDIITLLTDNGKSVLHCNRVQNEIFVAIKTLRIINQINEENETLSLKGNFVSYKELLGLIQDRILMEYFVTGSINILVITVGSYHDNKFSEEIAKKLINGLENPNQKAIIISTSSSFFTDKLREFLRKRYTEKTYDHDFSCLDEKSKEDILAKYVEFQGKPTTFGSLFNNNLNFANNIIDENVLLKITEENKKLCLLDTTAFSSSGYNESYYISRELFQKRVYFEVVKERMTEELFFITSTNQVGHKGLKKVLLQNNIDKNCIQDFPKMPKNGKRKIEKRGIMLRGLASESNENIFNEISERNIIVHWLLLWYSNLFHIDSNFKLRENKPLQIVPPVVTGEELFTNSHKQEKIIILAGDSGVGKSTVLTKIANCILNQSIYNVPVWIIKVNLRSFFEKKKKVGDLIKTDLAVNLISEMGSLSDSSDFIAKKIIEEGLKKSQENNFNLVLLLDGFNEISPSHQAKTCSLIKTANSELPSVKQIWITSQLQGKVKLESYLEVPAYTLDNLDEEKQINLMVKFWTTEYNSSDPPIEYDTHELQEDAGRAIQSWKKSINDNEDRSFTHVSLNVIILSDILLKDRKISFSTDLVSLYETFIHKKFSVYNNEITEPQRSLTEVEQIKEKMFVYSIKEILQEQSVKLILTTYQRNTDKLLKSMDALQRFEYFVEELQQNDIDVNSQTILSKIGFLSVKEEIEFNHESFAQYFFSDYLVKNMNNSTLKTFFVTHVLSENHLYLCRKFVNNIIKKHFETKNDKSQKYNIFASNTISPLPITKVKNSVKTRAVTKVIKEKQDYIIIFLLHITGTHREMFLEKWINDEIYFCALDEESVEKIHKCLVEEEERTVPWRLRLVIKADKSQGDNKSKVKYIVESQYQIGDDDSHTG